MKHHTLSTAVHGPAQQSRLSTSISQILVSSIYITIAAAGAVFNALIAPDELRTAGMFGVPRSPGYVPFLICLVNVALATALIIKVLRSYRSGPIFMGTVALVLLSILTWFGAL